MAGILPNRCKFTAYYYIMMAIKSYGTDPGDLQSHPANAFSENPGVPWSWIVVTVFQLNPTKFCMRGYPAFPDTKRIQADMSTMVARRWLSVGPEPLTYRITDIGLAKYVEMCK